METITKEDSLIKSIMAMERSFVLIDQSTKAIGIWAYNQVMEDMIG